MKTILNSTVVFLLLVLSSDILSAQTCPQGKTAFIWVNGVLVGDQKQSNGSVKPGAQVWTDQVQIIGANFFTAHPELNPTSTPNCVIFVPVYNKSQGFRDFLQATNQWLSQDVDVFLNSIGSIFGWLGVPDKFVSALKNYNAYVQLSDPDLVTLVGTVNTWSNQGYRVSLVGHSQGTFYTNKAYEVIRDKQIVVPSIPTLPDPNKLSIVNIASAAGYVADGRNKYTTQCGDIILQVPGSLPANVNNTTVPCAIAVPPGSALHDLDTAYLSVGLNTQKQIYAQLMDSLVTTTTLTSANSTSVWLSSNFYGGGVSDGDCRVGGWYDNYYCLIQPNLSGLPTSATKAVLRLYKYSPDEGTRSGIYLYRPTSVWNSATKWSGQPTAVLVRVLPAPVDGQWYEIDITDIYNGWQNGIYPKYGIELRPVSVMNNVHNTFRSPLYSDNNFRPQLVLTGVATTTSALPTNTSPTITLNGANLMSLNVGSQFTDPGCTAIDTEDGNITYKVATAGSVNIYSAGTYTLTYSVTDSGNLSASKTRTVNVVALPNSGVTITTLTSANSLVLWLPSTPGYYNGGMVNNECRVGGWGDEYRCLVRVNLSGLPTSASKAVLRLYKYPEGAYRSQIYLDRLTSDLNNGTKWLTQPGYTFIATLPAPVDGQWYEIDITALYNSWQNGTYSNYGLQMRPVSTSVETANTFRSPLYSDSNFWPQLVVTSATSVVNTAPVITLSGANPLSLNVGSSFVEPGYTATDKEDGNITSKVVVSNPVNTAVAGTYNVTYNVKDSSGLSATPMTRTVTVTAPILSGSCLVSGGSNSITLQTGNTAQYSAGFSGNIGAIHFLWTGATGGDTSSASQVYNYSGIYTASVRITDSASSPRQVTATCPQVTVTTAVVAPFATSCYITPSSIKLGASATYTANASGGYPPYIFNVPGTSPSISPFNAITIITPASVGTQVYSGFVQDSHGQVLKPTCSVTITK